MSADSPDYLRGMRTAAWMWLAYLAALVLVDMLIYAGAPAQPIVWYHLLNALPAVVFLALAYSPWLKSTRHGLNLLMMLLISAVPVLVSHTLIQPLPPGPLSNLEGMVIRQLPVLFIGLVLVGWHYPLVVMILFSVGLNLFELAVVLIWERLDPTRLTAFYFITLVRTVCFIVVGVFINQLITLLRAQQASLQAANARLQHYASTLESLTVSRERNRMSRELHDTVVHTLSGLSVQLEAAKAYWEVAPDTARNRLEQSLELTRSGLQETRRALKALRASPLDDLGLGLALRQLAETAAKRGALQLELALPEPTVWLSPDVEQCVYRIAQEAVENVVHHSNAKHLAVRLAEAGGEVRLVVRDDGVGFNAAAKPPAGHYGLEGMRERAHVAGGALTVESQPGRGTTLRLVLKGN